MCWASWTAGITAGAPGRTRQPAASLEAPRAMPRLIVMAVEITGPLLSDSLRLVVGPGLGAWVLVTVQGPESSPQTLYRRFSGPVAGRSPATSASTGPAYF